jgi:hypothetical protein
MKDYDVINGLKVPKVAPIMEFNENALQYVEKGMFIKLQRQHILIQSHRGVTAQMTTVRCRCGWNRSLNHMHQCLYCREYFCQHCAEVHFGKTVEEYRKEKEDEAQHD